MTTNPSEKSLGQVFTEACQKEYPNDEVFAYDRVSEKDRIRLERYLEAVRLHVIAYDPEKEVLEALKDKIRIYENCIKSLCAIAGCKDTELAEWITKAKNDPVREKLAEALMAMDADPESEYSLRLTLEALGAYNKSKL